MIEFSEDQAAAYDAVAERLIRHGVDLAAGELSPTVETEAATETLALVGRAGSGKTLLLAELVKALEEAGVEPVSAEFESRKRRTKRTFAVLAPTNKAASVLRNLGVPATTIHRIIYTPVYDPEYEKIAEWLTGDGPRPTVEGIDDAMLARAETSYQAHKSVPGALASMGLRGSDFITGWARRDENLDIGLVDEASMLDEKQFEDLKEIFGFIVLFGDPAQLAPVGSSGKMVFETLPEGRQLALSRIHRQSADNPILDLAHALADPALGFESFEAMIRDAAARDDRVELAERADPNLMTRSPMLVWRNATRIRLISAFRSVYGAPDDQLLPGEPLICDGVELPLKHRKKRIDLEARGLIKGAQVVYLGPGKRAGEEEPFIPYAARMGAVFLHGAACTIHKAQGSQWPSVQVFAPDLFAAARSGRDEAGLPLWKRLAYVAITRAQHRLIWVTRNRMARPDAPLGVEDLMAAAAEAALLAPETDTL
jgi:exodeoxyribonuclease-5